MSLVNLEPVTPLSQADRGVTSLGILVVNMVTGLIQASLSKIQGLFKDF